MKTMSKLSKLNKKRMVAFFAVILFLCLFYAAVSSNYSLYKTPIVRVTEVYEEKLGMVSGTNGNSEQKYKQILNCTVLNGSHKGEKLRLEKTYTESEVKSIKSRRGDKLLVSIKEGEDGTLHANYISEKRDNYLLLILALFVVAMILTAKRNSIFTLISLIVNISIFYIVLNLYGSRMFDWLWLPVILLCIVVTLVCAVGLRKKTLGAIISTIIATGLIYLVFYITVYSDSKMPYEFMQYMNSPDDLDKIFLASTIIGALGAIMDVSVTINSSVYELISINPDIEVRSLIKSVSEIGYDIMGTMINVLFFSYLSSTLTMAALEIHSAYTVNSIISYSLIFDIIRFLIGAIGIVLAIPVSGVVAVLLNKGGRK